ncbi:MULTISPECIES: TIGR03905 family TSCPD domain-containing protein [unclassified Oceanispirochaeta]|uniref:TIGR03905 family TSCPD domain-containing protein n=1 Tax=unclassified Oceanispirochaeta TaxID=2635722 RepID=UPI000E099C42|nr:MULTISPECIES: TIGR03905 family TSCPD domain-containing protein [unclassified Oceanispirochaeta]MBF9014912.1 TIGR03905 family TSCPD domain-containing protein [Oceanispirochaeta sp. M2]NPD71407.1 TIGR03905 family TSCPD domain-containing protein [Oceanispirochaeta sp. M1]RDG33438.1 TIGR03905 family TSCPD domain-containing protein [Oceanispirochaeta sp. M1]
MEKIEYTPEGTCSKKISIVLEDDRVTSLDFKMGCPGNLQAVKALVEGMKREDVIARLKGINCYGKGTSCPDQLAIALSGQDAKDAQKDQDTDESEAC